MKNNIEKQAFLRAISDAFKTLVNAGNKLVTDSAHIAAPALLGGPLALGFLLGKYRKNIADDSVETAEELKREVLKQKYDNAVLNAAKAVNTGNR